MKDVMVAEDELVAEHPWCDRVRPCEVTFQSGQREYAIFHGFYNGSRADKDGVRYPSIDAVVELRNGNVRATYPNRIRFLDTDELMDGWCWQE